MNISRAIIDNSSEAMKGLMEERSKLIKRITEINLEISTWATLNDFANTMNVPTIVK